MNRFDFLKFDETAEANHAQIKAAFQDLEKVLSSKLAGSRAQSLIMTHLEEAFMWVGKAIRDDQLARLGKTRE